MSHEQGTVQPWRENIERVREALWRIRENAKSWHGPLRDTGHEKALAVIASWCDAATTVFDVLTTQIEELERERDEAREKAIPPHWADIFARAEKAERALAEIARLSPFVSPEDDGSIMKAPAIARVALRPEDTSDE